MVFQWPDLITWVGGAAARTANGLLVVCSWLLMVSQCVGQWPGPITWVGGVAAPQNFPELPWWRPIAWFGGPLGDLEAMRCCSHFGPPATAGFVSPPRSVQIVWNQLARVWGTLSSRISRERQREETDQSPPPCPMSRTKERAQDSN